LIRWKEAIGAGLEDVADFWQRHPGALVGLPCGGASGLFVVDLDVDRATGERVGEASLAALGFGHLLTDPGQPRVRTPSGGLHLLFAHPGPGFRNTVAKLGDKVDTRGDGGFVIAAGTVTPNGRYTPEGPIDWRNLPPLPEGLRQALAAPERPAEPPTAPANGAATNGWGRAALAGELAKLLAAPVGQRNDALNKAAFKLAQAAASGGLDPEATKESLRAAALSIGLEPREVGATIASGWRAGLESPRGPEFRPAVNGAVHRAADGVAPWPEPDPRFLRPVLPPAPDLPLDDVLSPRLAEWVRDAAECKGAPADYVMGALLSVAGSLIGNSRWVSPWRGWAEPPIIWCMCIGLPSSGKSPALDAVLQPLRRVEAPLRQAAEAEVKAWDEKAKVARVVEASWQKAVEKAVQAGDPPPPRPPEADPGPAPHVPRLVVNDCTLERLGVICERQPRGLLQMRDELGGWLENMSRYSGGSDRPFWLEGYGGRAYVVERLSRGPLTVPRLSIAVLGGIQPDRLKSLLLEADDDGLLARFWPLWPEPVPVKRPTAVGNDTLIEAVLARLLTLDLVTGEDGELRPWLVPFDEPARALMDDFRAEVRRWEAEAEGLLLSFIGKLPGMAARLALVLACLDWASGEGDEPREIGVAHFGRAAHLAESYLLPMARRAYGEASVPKAVRAAKRLAQLIREQGWRTFSTRDVLRLDRAGLGTAAALNPALEVLEDADVIRPVEAPRPPQGGRPPRVYDVHPALHGGRP
jgi:hypothetical protein